MNLFAIFAIVISVTAILAWLNERFLKLPPTIGVMAAALSLSLLLTVAGQLGVIDEHWVAEELLGRVDFGTVLMQGMLSFLLFAGSLHVNLEDLLERKWSIFTLATAGVALSTFVIGTVVYYLLALCGIEMPYIFALLFGALISPTDPIAVLGILRKAGAPKLLESTIIGESLFNDGVGVVIFSMLLGLTVAGAEVSFVHAAELFLEEALGGVIFGLAIGYIAFRLLKSVDNYTVEILITLALVSGGYVLAGKLHTSGPIAMVVAGLFIGNHGRVMAMSDRTRDHLDKFWELIDEILNAVLFVMIGFEVLVLELRPAYLVIGLAAIAVVLAARYFCILLPLAVTGRLRIIGGRRVLALMTWGGIRGGISIALALSIPDSAYRDLILFVTYTIVVFSILVQGLTVGRVVRWATR